jgi:hypothetical protein
LWQNENLDEVAKADGGDEDDNDGFDDPHAHALHTKEQQHVEGRDEDGPD